MDSTAFFHDFTSLTERFSALAIRLSQAAQAVQETGVPPADDIAEEMKASRAAFTELCARGVTLAESLSVSPLPRTDTLSSLNDLKALLQLITETEQKIREARELVQRALGLLDRLYALQHRDREIFAPLAECQMRATILRNAIAETPLPQLHPQVEALLKDDNPFRVLLTLVEQGDQLEDESCIALQETVEDAFGKPLAIAALRGKLMLLDVGDVKKRGETDVSLSTPGQTHSSMKEELRDRPSTGAVTRLMPETIIEKPPLSPKAMPDAATVASRETMDLPPLRVASASLTEKPSDPHQGNHEEGEGADVEPWSVNESQPDTSEAVEEKFSAQASDNREEEVRSGPTRATFLQGALPVEPGGEKWSTSPASRDTSSSFHPALIPDPHEEETSAPVAPSQAIPPVSASPMPVAVAQEAEVLDVFYRFEPEDKAQKIANFILTGTYGLVEEKPAFLRDLVWRLIYEEKLSLAFHVARCLEAQHPEFYPRLPSWLLRAVTLGQRLRSPHGEIARILKEDLARWDTDCRPTGDKEWDLAVELLLIGAALFPAFLAPETRASTILHGVSLDDSLQELYAYCNVIALHGDLLTPLDPMSLKKQGRTQARESVGFVRRLIGAQDTDSRREIIAEQTEPLRIEVVNRQQAVLDEINLCKQLNKSVPLLGSLACCRRAVELVAMLFDPETPFSAEEPSPRVLLNSELSRIPTLVLSLNKQGDVEGIEKPAFTEHLLRLVASGSLKML